MQMRGCPSSAGVWKHDKQATQAAQHGIPDVLSGPAVVDLLAVVNVFLVLSQVCVKPHILVLPGQLGGGLHQVCRHIEGRAGRQAHPQHGKPAGFLMCGWCGT